MICSTFYAWLIKTRKAMEGNVFLVADEEFDKSHWRKTVLVRC